jgi:RHS repeat-associated protein
MRPNSRSYVSNNRVDGQNYDASGNLAGYRYDAASRITRAEGVCYLYDAEGRRVAKGTSFSDNVCENLTNIYVLGAGGEQLSEYDGSGNWKHTNVYGAGRLLATYDAAGTHFHLTDWLGTMRAQVSSNGVVDETCIDMPFGDDQNCSGPGVDATEHHFTGKVRDVETGFDYFGARYYASASGRWMSPDWSATAAPVPYAKLDYPQSLNLYAYVENNPLTMADADGHADDIGGCSSKDCQASEAVYLAQIPITIAAQAAKNKLPAPKQQSAPTPLKDSKGNVVNGASGSPALIPGGFDPNAVVKAGARDNALGLVSPALRAAATAGDLAKFRRGGSWDLQRLSGDFDPRFIDSATILIGMYAASAGVTRGQILSIENDVAKDSKYAAGTPMDSTYTHLPARNVTNTDIGMRLIQ